MAVRHQTLPYKEHQRLLRFLLVGASGTLLDFALLKSWGSATLPAKVFATAIVVFWNYFANHLWTFQEVQS